MLLNRFDDDLLLTADSLERPEYRRRTRVRGKARAIHTFRAQNNRQGLEVLAVDDMLVSWSLTSLFSTNMAISETNGHSL